MVNRYAGKCGICHNRVAARAGMVTRVNRRWVVYHLSCNKDDAPRVVATRFNSGATVYQNSCGRCIDAPCCGCCS